MIKNAFDLIVLNFAVYSVIGWMCEVVYCSVPAGKLVHRGLLAGPYCPIYGFGAVSLLLLLYPFVSKLTSIPLIFLIAFVITSAIEYFTSWLLEKMFHLRLWDYSKHKFNINGRVCLLNSTLFGIMSMILLYVIEGWINGVILSIPNPARTLLAVAFLVVFLLDTAVSMAKMHKFGTKLTDLHTALQVLKGYSGLHTQFDSNDISGSLSRMEALANETHDEKHLALVQDLRTLLQTDNAGRRLLASYANMKSHTWQENIELLKKAFEEKRKLAKAQKQEQKSSSSKSI